MAPAYVPPYTGQPGGDQTAYAQPRYDRAEWEAAQARADWLAECRRRHGNGNMVGGAIVGGVAGGLLGNAVAGRHDKTLGTVAGAVAGAAAGGAIGHGADTRRSRDYCESYLDRYTRAGYGYGQPGYGYGYAYQPMMVMVPVMMAQPVAAPAAPRRYTETTQVIEEWVPVTTPHRRYIPPRKRVAPPAKRIRVVPDKRVPL
ncbi:MAG: glycine zipper 2TM domain-containing protein [Proteobacteria bacterium]|nr:glycine zipper 2TM domain-containing protein [Pseudomonadota bacterium]